VDGVRCSEIHSGAGGPEYGLVKSWSCSRADGCRKSETGLRRLAEFQSTVLRAGRADLPALAVRDARSRDCVANRPDHLPHVALWCPRGPSAQAVALGGDARDARLGRWRAGAGASKAEMPG